MTAAMCNAWLSCRFPRRVEAVTYARSGGRFDRGGGVVAGVVPGGWEASDIAAVADEVGGHDGSDTDHVGDRGRRRVDRAGDAGLERDEVSVRGSHLGEELDGEAATLDPDLVGRPDAPQLESRPRP